MTLSRDEATIREKAILPLYFQLYKRDKHGTVSKIRLDEISTLVLDYFDDTAGSTINSRSDQDIKNANNVTVSALGEIVWTLQAADTTCVDTGLDDGVLEKHIAVIKWVLTNGQSGNMRQAIYIERESKV